MSAIKSILVLIPVLCASSIARAGNVLVVNAAGGAPFDNIQLAINSTDDGDVVLIKSGSYAGFTIGGKGIAVVADTNAVVSVSGAAVVRNVGAGKSVVLSGLITTGASNSTAAHGDGLYVENCTGAVRVERCTLNGADVSGLPTNTRSRPGAELLSSLNVAFAACTLRGVTQGSAYSGKGGDGLVLTASSASFYDCFLFGGAGNEGGGCQSLEGGPGGFGMRAASSFLFASHSSFVGGNGGAGPFHGCGSGFPDGGAGGDGVSFASSSQGKILQCVFAHGTGGAPGEGYGFCASCPGDPGPDGVDYVVDPSSHIDQLPWPARQMSAAGTTRESAPLSLQFHGFPGDQVMLLVWGTPSFVYSPTLLGMRLVIPPRPMLVWVTGTTDANGNFADSITFPDLGPGVQSGVVYMQSLFRDFQSQLHLGSNSSLVVLDSSF